MNISAYAACFFAFSAMFSIAAFAQANLDLQHPSIQEIRGYYQSAEKAISDGALKVEERSVEGCSPFGESRMLFSEIDGHIRKYVLDVGSDDSKLTLRHYYDEAGGLRFVFVTGGAVNGTNLEHRIYFDENGTRIRDDRKFTSGPGYPFPSFSDEEGLLATDPRKAYERNC